MADNQHKLTQKPMLNRNGLRAIMTQNVLILLSFIILFIAAGTLQWVNAWVYFGLVCLAQSGSWVVLVKVNPEVLNARASIVREGSKGFEKIWLVLYPVLSFSNLIVMGLDAVRFHWSSVPLWLSITGAVLFIPAMALATWALAVNKFFEWTVRIQKDRGQYVCTTGPYKYIRHPGYISLITSVMVGPLILGSAWGLVLSGITSVVVIIRTALEDCTLWNELSGYKEYAQEVKYRLVPFIW